MVVKSINVLAPGEKRMSIHRENQLSTQVHAHFSSTAYIQSPVKDQREICTVRCTVRGFEASQEKRNENNTVNI